MRLGGQFLEQGHVDWSTLMPTKSINHAWCKFGQSGLSGHLPEHLWTTSRAAAVLDDGRPPLNLLHCVLTLTLILFLTEKQRSREPNLVKVTTVVVSDQRTLLPLTFKGMVSVRLLVQPSLRCCRCFSNNMKVKTVLHKTLWSIFAHVWGSDAFASGQNRDHTKCRTTPGSGQEVHRATGLKERSPNPKTAYLFVYKSGFENFVCKLLGI